MVTLYGLQYQNFIHYKHETFHNPLRFNVLQFFINVIVLRVFFNQENNNLEKCQYNIQQQNIPSMQTLLTNIQGLLKVAADNASLQEKHASIEIGLMKTSYVLCETICSIMLVDWSD